MHWPDLDSDSVRIRRVGEDTTNGSLAPAGMALYIRDVIVDDQGPRTRNTVSCSATRTPAGTWSAGASIVGGEREP